MKSQIIYLIVGLLIITSANGQIKIGENPQNLDPASVLELESTSRALVITRVTDTQMNNIVPLRGALVYNTDQECIHYYNGIGWVNICEALDNSFTTTTEAIVNTASEDNTIAITQVDDNYNFEVNQIRGENVVPRTLFGSNLAIESITDQELQNGSVTRAKLAEGSTGISGELLRWDGAVWTLTNENSLNISEVDGEIGNEVLNATVGGSLERFGLGSDTNPYTLDVLDGGISTDELADNSVNNAKLDNGAVNTLEIVDNAVTTDKIGTAGLPDANSVLIADAAGDPQWEDRANFASSTLNNGQILVGNAVNAATGVTASGDATIDNTGTVDLAVNAVETDEIANDAVTNDKLAVDAVNTLEIVDNAVTTDKIGTLGAPDANRVLTTDAAGDPTWEDRANFASSTLNNGQIFVGNAVNAATGVTASGDATIDNTGTVDLAVNAVETDEIANDAVTNDKLAVDAVNTLELVDNAVTTDKIGTLGAPDANRVLTTDAAGDPTWEDRANFASSTLNNGQIFVGNAANAATGVTASGDATIDNTGTVDLAVNAVETDEIANDAVTNDKLAVDAVNTLEIVDNAVTTDKIGTAGLLDANSVLIADAAGDPQWEDRANFASSTLNNGQIYVGNAANTAIGVTASGDATIDNTGTVDLTANAVETDEIENDAVTNDKLATDAVTTIKIADANITPSKIEPSATNRQVLTTDGSGNVIWQTPYHAIGKANIATAVNALGVSSINNLGTGNYQVQFATNATSPDYIIQLTVLNAAASGFSIEVVTQAVSEFTVQITDEIGNPIDAEWFFTVTDF